MARKLTLVLGGVRAGKSSYAQWLAAGAERVLFVATAEPGDEEMEARIKAHQEARPAHWDTLEEPIDLVGALTPLQNGYGVILLDCLTLWVSNLPLNGPDPHSSRHDILPEVRRLLERHRSGDASWIVVSIEVGLGVVPSTQLGRIYADELGRVNQLGAAEDDEVYLVAAGLPVTIKTSRHGERAAHD